MATVTEVPTLFEGYRPYCLAEGKSPRTIRWYLGKLAIFLAYLQAEDLPTDAAELTTTDLRAFLVHLSQNVKADENNPRRPTQARSISPKTVQGYARTLKAFFSWLKREGYIVGNPGRLLRIPKAPSTIVQTFSDAQIRALPTLWKYTHKFRPEPFHAKIENLFLRTSGWPMRQDQVYRRIREYGKRAELQGVRCSPHAFRHTFAKKLLTNGGDLFSLQKILGHSSLEVVRMYVQLTSEDIQVQHRQYSPVDRIK